MKKKVVIFGAGKGGERAYRELKKKYDIQAFVDNDTSKQGHLFKSKPILSAEDAIKLSFDTIFIASMYGNQIYHQLKDLGVQSDNIDFVPEEVINGEKDLIIGVVGTFLLLIVCLTWFVF